jgi:hypothetical protein
MREIANSLIEKAAAGDMNAFEEIYREFSSTVYTVAYLMPGNGYLRNAAEQDDIFLISSVNGGDDEAGFGTPAEDIFL